MKTHLLCVGDPAQTHVRIILIHCSIVWLPRFLTHKTLQHYGVDAHSHLHVNSHLIIQKFYNGLIVLFPIVLINILISRLQ